MNREDLERRFNHCWCALLDEDIHNVLAFALPDETLQLIVEALEGMSCDIEDVE